MQRRCATVPNVQKTMTAPRNVGAADVPAGAGNASERLSVSAASQAPLRTGLPTEPLFFRSVGRCSGTCAVVSCGRCVGLFPADRPIFAGFSPTEAGFDPRLPEHLLRSQIKMERA